MKKLIFVILFLFVIPPALAISIDVEKTSVGEILIADFNKPVIFDLKITNNGNSDNFEFYNLLGFSMFPVGTVPISQGEVKEIKLGVSPLGSLSERGFYSFDYFIRGQDGSQIMEQLTFKILDLEDVFRVGSGDVDPESNRIEIFIKNTENIDFGEIDVVFSSAFFDVEKTITLGPNEEQFFDVELDSEDFRDLIAGFYTLRAELNLGGVISEVEGIIKFVEKDLVTTTKKDYGFLINTNIIEKKNEGNVLVSSETVIKKNIISRLFTSFSPQPDIVEREGSVVYYTWSNEISPGETMEITVKTNWLFPLLIIAFVVAIVALVKQYSRTHIVLKKKVTFVKAKGGEFALKVSILVNAKKYVERVNVIDRLPPLVDIYERFGGDKPTRIDQKNRRMEWNFEKLEVGEIRVLSYIIYSKIGVLGRFALPTATAIYEREGDVHEVESNRAFFMAEQKRPAKEEE